MFLADLNLPLVGNMLPVVSYLNFEINIASNFYSQSFNHCILLLSQSILSLSVNH